MIRHNSGVVCPHKCQGKAAHPIRVLHGLSVTELLVAVLLLAILMLAAFSLFKSSWQSYDNLVWQTKVNMEARQALDEVCDTLRTGGTNMDMSIPRVLNDGQYQVDLSSTANKISFYTPGFGYLNYTPRKYAGNQTFYLDRWQGASANLRLHARVSQYIKSVEFEYEYRLPAGNDADRAWRFIRVRTPTKDAYYLVTAVYVTVTAEAQPYGSDGPVYHRTMTGAVHLRSPYGMVLPPAIYTDTPLPPDTNE